MGFHTLKTQLSFVPQDVVDRIMRNPSPPMASSSRSLCGALLYVRFHFGGRHRYEQVVALFTAVMEAVVGEFGESVLRRALSPWRAHWRLPVTLRRRRRRRQRRRQQSAIGQSWLCCSVSLRRIDNCTLPARGPLFLDLFFPLGAAQRARSLTQARLSAAGDVVHVTHDSLVAFWDQTRTNEAQHALALRAVLAAKRIDALCAR